METPLDSEAANADLTTDVIVSALNQASLPLDYNEDEELRRLNYLAEVGTLTGLKAERLIELRLRDRRSEVRPPRGFIVEEVPPPKRKWYNPRGRKQWADHDCGRTRDPSRAARPNVV